MRRTRNTSLDAVVTDFLLLGLAHPPNLRAFLFLVFFLIYILTQLGNLLILLTVWADPKLHARPMYILLGVLSFLDMWLSSVIVPRIILNFTPASKVIAFGGCAAQLYFFHFLGSTQCFLYTLMAYDRYLARTGWAGTRKEKGKRLYMLAYHMMDYMTVVCPAMRWEIGKRVGMKMLGGYTR